MPKTLVEFENENVDSLVGYLVGMEDRVTDFSVPGTDIAKWIVADVKESFPSGGASVGETWAKHSEATIERWGAHPFGQGPTGNLVGSIVPFTDPFIFGALSTAPHAHLFENGRQAPGGGTPEVGAGGESQPARYFMKVTEQRMEQGAKRILDYVTGT